MKITQADLTIGKLREFVRVASATTRDQVLEVKKAKWLIRLIREEENE